MKGRDEWLDSDNPEDGELEGDGDEVEAEGEPDYEQMVEDRADWLNG